ncbi:MAG: glycosyltransferase [Chlamydiia bacterium]|nr:glycosyltransferase [Chlamydiia bacterium]
MRACPRLLILAFSDMKRDARVLRQVEHCINKGYHVTVCAETAPDLPVDFVSSRPPVRSFKDKAAQAWLLARKQHDTFYWTHPRIQRALSGLSGKRFDLVIANDIDTLPLALRIAEGRPVLCDLHEYAPREYDDRLLWRLLFGPYKQQLCDRYLGQCTGWTTVCEGIAREYRQQFGIHASIVLNAPARQDLRPQAMDDGIVRMIYHGSIHPSREVESVFDILDRLDPRFVLDMILIPCHGQQRYHQRILRRAEEHSRVRVLDPVPPRQIATLCNTYDIGFFPLAATNFNYYYALPNKFFEFIQARTAVVTSRLPEMTRYIDRYGCGAALELPPELFAKGLNSLSHDAIWQMKCAADTAARELCAENSLQVLQKLIENSLNPESQHVRNLCPV